MTKRRWSNKKLTTYCFKVFFTQVDNQTQLCNFLMHPVWMNPCCRIQVIVQLWLCAQRRTAVIHPFIFCLWVVRGKLLFSYFDFLCFIRCFFSVSLIVFTNANKLHGYSNQHRSLYRPSNLLAAVTRVTRRFSRCSLPNCLSSKSALLCAGAPSCWKMNPMGSRRSSTRFGSRWPT